jgi:hypothetical protein
MEIPGVRWLMFGYLSHAGITLNLMLALPDARITWHMYLAAHGLSDVRAGVGA